MGDHHTFGTQKQLGRDNFAAIPNGIPVVENRMELIFDAGVVGRRINLNRFVEITATAPAKMFGLFPKKGTIAVGSDADIVILDPDRTHTISVETHHMDVDYSAFEGREITGKVETVLSKGEVIIADGRYHGRKGDGEYLRRGTDHAAALKRTRGNPTVYPAGR